VRPVLVLAQSEHELTERFYVDLADIVDHVAGASALPLRVDAAPASVVGSPGPVVPR
jgi:hypothetical protein